jgi:acetoin utilization protein AcuC
VTPAAPRGATPPVADVVFVYSPDLSRYRLSDTHPFKPLRLELTRSLLQSCGLLGAAHEVAPRRGEEEQLFKLHTPDYVDAVKRVSRGEPVLGAVAYGLGTADNPIFPGMHEAILSVCGATQTAVELVASGRVTRALSLSGGLHHAQAGQMSGFCTYNDVALAIQDAVTRFGARVAYLDLDAHHGDGVQGFFYESAEVMTVSLHESGRYLFPGTGHTFEVGRGPGRGLSVNVPLEPFTEDDSYLEVFDAVVPTALAVFRPDLIVLQAGADMHRFDPLADLNLSVQGISESYRRVVALAERFCGGRLVATGGGGYDPYHAVPRLWALLWAVLSEKPLPKAVPEAWRAHWQGVLTARGELAAHKLPRSFTDPPWPPSPRRAAIAAANRLSAKRLLATLEPIWRERFGRP